MVPCRVAKAKTASRSVLDVMNEFGFLADAHVGVGRRDQPAEVVVAVGDDACGRLTSAVSARPGAGRARVSCSDLTHAPPAGTGRVAPTHTPYRVPVFRASVALPFDLDTSYGWHARAALLTAEAIGAC